MDRVMAETLIKIKLFPDKYSKKVIDHVRAETLIIQFTEDGDLGGNYPRLQRREEEDDITDLNRKTKRL